MTKFSSGEDPCILVRDSNSFVISDIYMEGTPNNIHLAGNDGDPAGRVTIQGGKFERGNKEYQGNPQVIDNYHGELSIVFDALTDPIQKFVVHGSNPMSMLFLGDYFSDSVVSLQSGPNGKFHCLADEGYKDKTIHFDCPPSLKDTDFQEAAPQASRAFDDLRKLGETDLKLNHPEVPK